MLDYNINDFVFLASKGTLNSTAYYSYYRNKKITAAHVMHASLQK